MAKPRNGEIWKYKNTFYLISTVVEGWVEYTQIWPKTNVNGHGCIMDIWLEKFRPAKASDIARLRKVGAVITYNNT